MDGSFYYGKRLNKETSISARDFFIVVAVISYAALMTLIVVTRRYEPSVEGNLVNSIANTWGFGP